MTKVVVKVKVKGTSKIGLWLREGYIATLAS
jgi:hypothetical protein